MSVFRKIIPFLIIILMILVFSLIPYFQNEQRIQALKQNEMTQCKLNKILIKFATTAEHARAGTAILLKGQLGEKLVVLNREAAQDYAQIIKDLNSLPKQPGC